MSTPARLQRGIRRYRELPPERAEAFSLGIAVLEAISPEPKTLDTVAAATGCTREYVRQLEISGLAKLRTVLVE